MSGIIRHEINEDWAHAGIIEAGDFVFIGYCAGNTGGTVEEQIDAVFDQMTDRLAHVGLTLESVVKMDALFSDIRHIPLMEAAVKKRFNGKYPVRKSFERDSAYHRGEGNPLFQIDAIAYKG